MKDRDETFETIVSYILIAGVILSLLTEITGLSLYYIQNGNLSFDYSPQWQLKGANFFAYAANLITSFSFGFNAISIMALGIVLLMITPYVRVIASVVYFGRIRDLKYLLFTIFVLTVLTVSLIIH